MAKISARGCFKLDSFRTPTKVERDDESYHSESWDLFTLRSDGVILSDGAFKRWYHSSGPKSAYTSYSGKRVWRTLKPEIVAKGNEEMIAAFHRVLVKYGYEKVSV